MKKIIFLIIIITFFIITIEFSLSFFINNGYKIRDKKLLWKNKPNSIIHKTNQILNIHFDIQYNNYGFRGNEFNLNKKNILLLGDSFINASYLPDSLIINHFLDNYLDSNFQVLNAGCDGYGTDQELILLNQYINDIKINHVFLFFFIGNDFFDNYYKKITLYNNGKISFPKGNNNWKYCFKNFLINHSNIIKLTVQTINQSKIIRKILMKLGLLNFNNANTNPLIIPEQLKIFEKKYDMWLDNAVDKSLLLIKSCNDLCKKNNIKFTLIIIPTIFQIDDYIIDNKENYDLLKPNNYIQDFCKTKDINIYDLTEDFKIKFIEQKDTTYNYYNYHWNSNGHKQSAIIINSLIQNYNKP